MCVCAVRARRRLRSSRAGGRWSSSTAALQWRRRQVWNAVGTRTGGGGEKAFSGASIDAAKPAILSDHAPLAARGAARVRAVAMRELLHELIRILCNPAPSAGYIVQSCLRWPGYLSPSTGIKFADMPNGIAALKAVPPLGLLQIVIFIGLMETQTWRFLEGPWPGQVPEGKLPGDVAGDFWVRYTDPEEKKYKLNIELNNGRAAMLGITGMLMHDHITGSWIPPGF